MQNIHITVPKEWSELLDVEVSESDPKGPAETDDDGTAYRYDNRCIVEPGQNAEVIRLNLASGDSNYYLFGEVVGSNGEEIASSEPVHDLEDLQVGEYLLLIGTT